MSDIRIKMAKDLRDMSDMVGDLHWMAAKAVEDLIKKDARIVELESELVLRREDHYRIDAELAAIKAQEPVGFAGITLRSFTKYKSAMHCLPLYAAPVSEAKAQGVVMPERKHYHDYLSLYDKGEAIGHNNALAEVARLNAAPVQQVSVPDGYVRVPIELTDEMLRAMKIQLDKSPVFWCRYRAAYRAMLAAAPAAPAADTAQAYEIGIYGKAYDLPSKRRAYTYDEQPDNVVASRLACALSSVEPGGDSIDHGLSLLNQLQEAGFGVFELATPRAQRVV